MSKADTLGAAPAFGAARNARSSRRTAIAKTVGDDTAAAAITELPVTVISDNPDNPRNHLRNLDETVDSVREHGIILPIVVGTVEAYLRDRTDRADDLDQGAEYVVIDGHRRLEAARRVGLAIIPVRVDNARLATDEALLEAAFVANYHRDDMTDLEEAHALQQLVEYYGSQTKASKRLGIPQNTISSKLSLLKLAPELQRDLMAGARKVEHVRNLGKLSPEEQKAKADERAAAARRRTDSALKSAPAEQAASPAGYHGVIVPRVSRQQPTGEQTTAAVPQQLPSSDAQESRERSISAGDALPERRADPEPQPAPVPEGRRLPYDQGGTVGRHLVVRMDQGPFLEATEVMVAQCWDKAGTGPSLELLRTMLRTAAERSPDLLRELLADFTAQLEGEKAAH